MQFAPLLASRQRAAVFALVTSVWATVAAAQTPTLTASRDNVVPGTSVTLTVPGPPGEHFGIIDSIVGHGGTYAGVELAVGADYVAVAQGVLDGMGLAVVPFSPPFLGSVIDRVYLQVATSMSPVFASVALSPGLVLRNNDLVSGLSGVAGPAGPVGAAGPAGLTGPPGVSGAMGTAGAAGAPGIPGLAGTPGSQGTPGTPGTPGVPGLQGLPGVGFRTDCGGSNIAVWNATPAVWECSTALSDLQVTVQTLINGLSALQVDPYLNTLMLSTAIPISTSLAVTGNNSGTACLFGAGTAFMYVFGYDNQNGYPRGRVSAFDDLGNGYFDVSGSIPVTTAQVLARCATGQPYIIAR